MGKGVREVYGGQGKNVLGKRHIRAGFPATFLRLVYAATDAPLGCLDQTLTVSLWLVNACGHTRRSTYRGSLTSKLQSVG